ncbi:MAG: FKBP-type peptidyl-prolyl cis-trans isomerase [Tannerella sp.]|jgi:FKBP-type peptidyl-prolyl cis-trans isomerase FklB|nr:FKBP-type peptidyl-prolyl cis-trans isomerase [Tannerella sp.]
MKRINYLFTGICLIFLLGACNTGSHKLKNDVDTLSYFFGYARTDGVMGYLASQAGVDTAYMDDFYKGFKDGAKHYSPADVAYQEGKKIAMMINNQWFDGLNREIFLGDSTQTVNRELMLAGFYQGVKHGDMNKVMQANSISTMKMEALKEIYKKEKYAESIAANEKFLADNKEKEGVKTTPSGLQYKILTEGTGEIPADTSKVKVNYRGTLIDGKEFDSSKSGQPSSFRVTQVIKGWTEALKMMPVGSKWEIYVPQELAYKSAEQGNIPPYSTLIFEVELVEIEK